MIRDNGLASRLWRFAIWAVVVLFVLNLLGVILAVVVNSLSTRWLGTWLPLGWTTHWYVDAWREFQLTPVLIVTFEIVFAVVIISGLVGVTTAYALARRDNVACKISGFVSRKFEGAAMSSSWRVN